MNHGTQLVSLLLELARPLRLHGEVATDFSDVALDKIRQVGRSRPLVFAQPAACDGGLRHGHLLVRRILTVGHADVCALWNGTHVFVGALAVHDIDVPVPAATDLAAILSVSYHATLLREDSRPVTFRLALSEPAFLPPQETAEPESRVDAAFAPVLAGHVLRRVRATVRAAQHGGTLILIPRARVSEFLSDGRYAQAHLVADLTRVEAEHFQRIRHEHGTVVSQDGGLRFIRWHDQSVAYWEQVATGPLGAGSPRLPSSAVASRMCNPLALFVV